MTAANPRPETMQAVARLYHAYMTGLMLTLVTRRSAADAAEWVYRVFRHQHHEKFLSSFDKLGLRGMPDAVACGAYHYLSNTVGGVTVEFMSHTGFTAANRDASIQQANFQSTTYADSRGNVKDLEAKVARMSDERSLMKPVNSPAKAKAVIQFSEAHKFWNSTDNCKATKGPQTRAFCDAYLSAQADLSLWDSIAKQETKIAEGEVALRDARAESGTKQAGHAAGASQSMILASLATGQENPDQAAQFWSGVGVSALLALFAIAAGGLLNFIAFAFDAPRKAVEAAKSAAANMVASINDRPQSRPLTLLDQFRSEGRLAA